MPSTVTRSQPSSALLECGAMGDSQRGCAANKPAATVWCCHVNMDKISDEYVPHRIKAVQKAKWGPTMY